MKVFAKILMTALCLLPATICLFTPLTAYGQTTPLVTIQMEESNWQAKFQPLDGDIPLIPLRGLADECGATVGWNEESGLVFYYYDGRAVAFHRLLDCVYIFEENLTPDNNSPPILFTCFEVENPLHVQGGVSYLSGDNLPFLAMEAFWDELHIDIGLSPEAYKTPRPQLATADQLYQLCQEDFQLRISQLPRMISSYTTKFSSKEQNRTINLKLAAAAINEVRIMPGQEFSFNNIVGIRSPQKGYLKAIIFSSGDKILGYGGGVCQVSTTLYNTVLAAGLKVTERHPHGQKVTYVPAGKDATVVYGVKDFRFINSTDEPLTIKVVINPGSLEIQLWAGGPSFSNT